MAFAGHHCLGQGLLAIHQRQTRLFTERLHSGGGYLCHLYTTSLNKNRNLKTGMGERERLGCRPSPSAIGRYTGLAPGSVRQFEELIQNDLRNFQTVGRHGPAARGRIIRWLSRPLPRLPPEPERKPGRPFAIRGYQPDPPVPHRPIA